MIVLCPNLCHSEVCNKETALYKFHNLPPLFLARFLAFFLFYVCKHVCVLIIQIQYSKTCVKRPLKNRQNKGLKDKW